MTAKVAEYAEVDSIRLPECERGLGAIILRPDSPQLISGVQVTPFSIYPDDRGCFMEVVRMRTGMIADFPAETTQVSAAINYPGTIKAFHYHRMQTDYWVPASGMLQVALVDLRPESETFGARNTFYVGSLRPWQIFVPPRVGHGYKVIGAETAFLVYVTNRLYNPADEGRIPYNDPSINYDWETQHK